METRYDDRLDSPDIQLAVETVALPKTLTALPILIGVIFILFSIWSVNTIRKSIANNPSLRSVNKDHLENVFTSVEGSISHNAADYHAPGLSTVFTPEVKQWREQISYWSKEHDLPENLIAIVMQIESCGDPLARSMAGAIGLFQVMPYHFTSGEDPFDVTLNATKGLDYLSDALELSGGRIDLALAGYNGGHTQIMKSPQGWPDETIRYVRWGFGIWKDIQAEDKSSQTLEHWLDAGGRFLCENNSDG